ncbi:MAG: hypothetical protein ACE5IM_04615 [Nitrospinota bacterium]
MRKEDWEERAYGHRARIGLIVPANNNVIEPEFWKMAPEGVAFYATRLPVRGPVTDETFRRMEADADRAVEELATARVQALAFCDMGIALVMEAGWGERRVARIREGSGLPATTGALAMLDALKALGVRRVALATPYPESLHRRAGPFFERNGHPCAGDANLPISDPADVGKVPPSRVYDLLKSADRPDAEALLLLATDIRSIEALQALEDELRKPVLSTNACLMWKVMRLTGVDAPIEGYGRLLSGKSEGPGIGGEGGERGEGPDADERPA